MRIKPLVVLSLVCSLSQAADTVASLGDSIKATQFVTAVDHTRLINGTTEVIANQNGTASISTAQSVQKPNCVRISQADGSTGKTIVLSFRNTSSELSNWWRDWPDQIHFSVEYDGISYEAETVGETDDEDGRTVSCGLSWFNGCTLVPASVDSQSYWQGVIYNIHTPGGLRIIGDGNGESCSTYTYTSSTGTSALIATVPFVDGHKWDWSTQITNKSNIVTSIAIGRNNTGVSGDIELVLTHADPSVTLTTNYPTGIKIGSLSYTAGFAQLDIFEKGGPGFSPDWANQPLTTDIYIPSNVSAFNNDAGYVPASTATNIAKQIIRDAVSGVNTDIQTAEDARVALTNLITILKNL